MAVMDIIAQRRKELGLTLEELGNMVGVGKSTVAKWERGYIKNMRRDKIALLARALRVSPVALTEDEESIARGDDAKSQNAELTWLSENQAELLVLFDRVTSERDQIKVLARFEDIVSEIVKSSADPKPWSKYVGQPVVAARGGNVMKADESIAKDLYAIETTLLHDEDSH